MPLPKEKSTKEKNYLKRSYLFIGEPKIGKSTLASGLGDDKHKILFFTTEKGHNFLEIYKWQTKDGHDPTSWENFVDCIKELTAEKHDFSCLCIDVTDNLFKWCSKAVCKREGIKHESDLSFGKGYALIKDAFEAPINYLTQKGIGVIFVSHAQDREKEVGPRKINYTDSTLPNTAKKIVHGLVDFIFYIHSDDAGNRVLNTKGTENYNAGDRSGVLPEQLPLDSKILRQHLIDACN